MNANVYVIEDYDNVIAYRPKKTNPIKANFFKGQNEQKIAYQKIQPHPMIPKANFCPLQLINKGLNTVTKCDIIMADKLSSKAH